MIQFRLQFLLTGTIGEKRTKCINGCIVHNIKKSLLVVTAGKYPKECCLFPPSSTGIISNKEVSMQWAWRQRRQRAISLMAMGSMTIVLTAMGLTAIGLVAMAAGGNGLDGNGCDGDGLN